MKGASLNPVDFEIVIYTSPRDVTRIATEAWEALITYDDPSTIFRFGGTVVRLKTSEGDEPISLETMTKDRMKYHLNRSAKFLNSEGNVTDAPHSVASDMLAHPDPPLPRLRRIVNHPVYTQNKILCLTPGYSKEGEIYIHTDTDLFPAEIPNIPSTTDLEMAVEIVREIFVDFPFASTSDKANALAILILPFVMDLIDGPTPLHFIEAPSPGTGKTLLAFAIGKAVTGKQIATKTE